MIRHTTVGILGLALAVGAPLTYAKPIRDWNLAPYIGAGWGEYKLDFKGHEHFHSDFDDNQDVWRVFGGLQFNDVLGAEITYYEFDDAKDRGRHRDHHDRRYGGLEADLDGWSIAAVFSAPLHDRFAVFAKVGWFWWEADINHTQTVIPGERPLRKNEDGDDVFFGAGLNIGVTEHLQVRLEYDRFELDEDINPNLDAASVSLQWRF